MRHLGRIRIFAKAITRFLVNLRRHHKELFESRKIARRVSDPDVLSLIKQILKAGGKIGVPQGGPFSPLAAITW